MVTRPQEPQEAVVAQKLTRAQTRTRKPTQPSTRNVVQASIRAIRREHFRLLEQGGFWPIAKSPDHIRNEFPLAAASYIMADQGDGRMGKALWPFATSFQLGSRKQNLHRAVAYIFLELDRIAECESGVRRKAQGTAPKRSKAE